MVEFIGLFIGQELKAFDSDRHAGLLHKFKCYGISGQIFAFISTFCSNRPLRVVLDGNSWQEYQVNAGVSQVIIFGPTLATFLMMLSVTNKNSNGTFWPKSNSKISVHKKTVQFKSFEQYSHIYLH